MGAKDLQQRAALVKLGKELQELMGLDPPINVKAKSPQLKAQIAEAASNLSTEEGDADKLSESAIETLKTIGCEDDLIRIGAIEAPKTPKKGPRSKKVKEEEPEDEDGDEDEDEEPDEDGGPDEDPDGPDEGVDDDDEPEEDGDEPDEDPDEDEEPPAKAKKAAKKPPKKAAKAEEPDEDEDGGDEPDEEPDEDEEPPAKKSSKKVKEEAPAKRSKDAGKTSDEPGKKKSKRKGGKKSRYSRIEAAFAVLNDKPKMPLEKAIQAADDFYTKHCDRGSNMKEAKRQTQRVVRIFELLGMRPDNHTSS